MRRVLPLTSILILSSDTALLSIATFSESPCWKTTCTCGLTITLSKVSTSTVLVWAKLVWIASRGKRIMEMVFIFVVVFIVLFFVLVFLSSYYYQRGTAALRSGEIMSPAANPFYLTTVSYIILGT